MVYNIKTSVKKYCKVKPTIKKEIKQKEKQGAKEENQLCMSN